MSQLFWSLALMAVMSLNAGVAFSEDTPVTTTTTSTVEKTGVQECDDYFSKYSKCISDKVPQEARSPMMTALNQTAQQWKQLVTTPEGKTALATSCKMAMDATKKSMETYQCEW